MEEIIVENSLGKWVLKKPKAGVRNTAMLKAERASGEFSKVMLLTELLPKCIKQRPEQIDQEVDLVQILNDLSIKDYDMIAEGFWDLMKPEEDENQKKT